VTTGRPLVSVLLPTYNGKAFVAETIQSVLTQTYEPIELVVIDDASTDETLEIVERYAAEASGRIKVDQRGDRRGPCRRRNDALEAANGSLLAWLDQDDLWLPEKIARQVDVLEANPRVGVVHTAFDAFDSETGETLENWPDPGVGAEGELLVPLFVQGNLLASITALFRRSALERRGLRFREKDFSYGDDYYLWLALSLDWRFARIGDTLARYRRHPDNESARLARTNFHARRAALLMEFLRDFPEANGRLGRSRRVGLAKAFLDAAGFEALTERRIRQARYVARALAVDPVWTVRTLKSQSTQT
jgi:glycosyltransferase involved in cell wall biosynthesis